MWRSNRPPVPATVDLLERRSRNRRPERFPAGRKPPPPGASGLGSFPISDGRGLGDADVVSALQVAGAGARDGSDSYRPPGSLVEPGTDPRGHAGKPIAVEQLAANGPLVFVRVFQAKSTIEPGQLIDGNLAELPVAAISQDDLRRIRQPDLRPAIAGRCPLSIDDDGPAALQKRKRLIQTPSDLSTRPSHGTDTQMGAVEAFGQYRTLRFDNVPQDARQHAFGRRSRIHRAAASGPIWSQAVLVRACGSSYRGGRAVLVVRPRLFDPFKNDIEA